MNSECVEIMSFVAHIHSEHETNRWKGYHNRTKSLFKTITYIACFRCALCALCISKMREFKESMICFMFIANVRCTC